MVIGSNKIIESTKILIDNIEKSTINDLVEVDEVFVISIVRYADPDENHSSESLFYYCPSAKYHTQRGILAHAEDAVRANQVINDI